MATFAKLSRRHLFTWLSRSFFLAFVRMNPTATLNSVPRIVAYFDTAHLSFRLFCSNFSEALYVDLKWFKHLQHHYHSLSTLRIWFLHVQPPVGHSPTAAGAFPAPRPQVSAPIPWYSPMVFPMVFPHGMTPMTMISPCFAASKDWVSSNCSTWEWDARKHHGHQTWGLHSAKMIWYLKVISTDISWHFMVECFARGETWRNQRKGLRARRLGGSPISWRSVTHPEWPFMAIWQ